MGALVSKLEYVFQTTIWGADAQATGSTNQPQKTDENIKVPRPQNATPGSYMSVTGLTSTDIGNLGAPLGNRSGSVPRPVADLDKGPSVWDIAAQQANGYDVAVFTPNTNNIQPLQKTEATPINSSTIPSELSLVPPGQDTSLSSTVNKNNISGGSQKHTGYYFNSPYYSRDAIPVMDHPRTVLAQARVDPNPPGMTKGSVRPPGAGDWLGNLLSNQSQQENVALQRAVGSSATLASGSGVYGPVYQTMKMGYQRIANPRQRMSYQV